MEKDTFWNQMVQLQNLPAEVMLRGQDDLTG